jgi:uncharacterized protein YndB with AHSA1/START domain
MSDTAPAEDSTDIALEFLLDAPPAKVWRALSIPAFREQWLPDAMLTNADATIEIAGERLRLDMRETAPPFIESTVTFRLSPDANGGTVLKIVHRRAQGQNDVLLAVAANNNAPLMRAA